MPDTQMTFEEIKDTGSVFFEKLWNSFIDYIPTLIVAIIVLIIGTIINRLVIKLLGKGLEKSRLDKTIHVFLSSVIKITLYSVIMIIVITLLGIPMTSIIAVVGSVGLAIGLSIQNSLSNVAGGIIILVGKPFKSGDFVDINGTSGTVSEISIITTKLITSDNKIIYLPNSSASNAVVINFNEQSTRRIEITFSISYENEFRKAINIIRKTACNHEKVLDFPEPFVRVCSLGSNSIDIITRIWVNSSDYWDVYYDMLELVKESFDNEGIIIPYNQLDVHLDKNQD